MQADLVLKTNYDIAKKIGDIYENYTNNLEYKNNFDYEYNMDSWNNNVGREIGIETKAIIKGKEKQYTKKQLEDMVAEKIIQRMKNGDLITDPFKDTRQYKDYDKYFKNKKQGNITGQAAPFHNIYTREMIHNMSNDDFLQNQPLIFHQLKTSGFPIENLLTQHNDISGFFNEISGNSIIFTREDINNMSYDEYLKNEKPIFFQLNSIGIPSLHQARLSGTKFIFWVLSKILEFLKSNLGNKKESLRTHILIMVDFRGRTSHFGVFLKILEFLKSNLGNKKESLRTHILKMVGDEGLEPATP